MKAEEIQNACVIGAGTMGHGIAQILAVKGINVTLIDQSDELVRKGKDRIQFSLSKFVEKRAIKQADAEAALQRIKLATNYDDARTAEIAVEAIYENLEAKKKLLTELDKIAPPSAILASNTSTLSVTEMSKATKRPAQVVGMHFFNPPQLMPLVEVIKGQFTSDETAETAMQLASRIGKTPILVRRDVRGFIVNGVLGPLFNEIFWILYHGEASKEEIDASAKYVAGLPMGIFELADFIGLDIIHDASQHVDETQTLETKICPILEPMVKEGKLGQKSGEGFYKWSEGRPRIPFEIAEKFDVNRIYLPAINSAAWLVKEGVAIPKDIDTGLKFGLGWPSGPCEIADRIGIDSVVSGLRGLRAKYGEETTPTCPLIDEYVQNGWLGKKSGRGFYKYD